MDELLKLFDEHPDLIVTFRKECYMDFISIKFTEIGNGSDVRSFSRMVNRDDFKEFFNIILHNMEDSFYKNEN